MNIFDSIFSSKPKPKPFVVRSAAAASAILLSRCRAFGNASAKENLQRASSSFEEAKKKMLMRQEKTIVVSSLADFCAEHPISLSMPELIPESGRCIVVSAAPIEPPQENTVMSLKSFIISADTWLKDHFKTVPSLEVRVSSALNKLVPYVESIDTEVSLAIGQPEVALIVNPILEKIKVGFAAIAVTITDATTPEGSANLGSILASVNANINDLESAAQVKDEASQAKITAAIAVLSADVNGIASSLPAVVPDPVADSVRATSATTVVEAEPAAV
jgi:hypothetical protein